MKSEDKLILIIEDENNIRSDLQKVLELSGYSTMIAPNGNEGVDLAIQYIPDLIICDIMMPDMDGYGVLQKIHSNKETSDIPFLFLTAKSSKVNIRKGMREGADDYLTKPYDVDELIDAVKIRLKRKEVISSEYNKKINELKNTVHRNIPHEIRTPINIVLGLSEFLEKNYDKTDKEDFVEMLHNINDAGKRLHRLFENYLFYANLELLVTSNEDKKKLRKSKTPLVFYTLKDLIINYSKNVGRNEDLELNLDDASVAMNEYYLTKMIEEIIDNAFKFSKPGTPVKIYSVVEKSHYLISFTDFGRGMTKEQIENIDAYVQFERKIYEQQGSGLGLTIVKHIVDIHNGEFSIKSEPNYHTTVEIKIPLAKI